MLNNTSAFVRDLWALARPYWFSEERWAARGLLTVIVALNLGIVYLNVLFNAWYGRFYNALQNHEYPAFLHELLIFSILAAIYIAVAVYRVYLNQMLQIRWRRWLTRRYIDEWLGGQTYYRMQLVDRGTDNPDQRISEDLKSFVEQTLILTLGLLSAIVTLFSFLSILWTLSGPMSFTLWGVHITVPGYMVWAALVYSIVGTALTHWIGRPLISLNFQQQRLEANFRFSLVRFRENAEAVALYRGEPDEAAAFGVRFMDILHNWWAIMVRQKKLTWFTAGYGQAAVIFPFLVASPRYFSGAIELGGLMQTASAFGQVQDSLSWFVTMYTSLADWKATVDRLTGFRAAMEGTRRLAAETPQIARVTGDEAGLVLDDVALSLPNSRADLMQANMRVNPGDAVLVTGPSGAGKSTLFRAIAGIWPFGRGAIRMPKGASVLFLPQKPYMPIASLRDAVAYPAPARSVDDARIREVLGLCQLDHLVGRLDEVDHWANRLSPGEQQRIALARAVLHQPDWLFLDEATSALDGETEWRLFQVVKKQLPKTTIVSIGHRTSLAAFHDRHLAVEPDGTGGPNRLVELPRAAVAFAT